MASRPRTRNCRGCSHSRLIKGAQCFCTLRRAVIPPGQMLTVSQCELAQAHQRKAGALVAEAKAARAARRQEDRPYAAQPMVATG